MRLKGQLTHQIIATAQQELGIKADNGHSHKSNHKF